MVDNTSNDDTLGEKPLSPTKPDETSSGEEDLKTKIEKELLGRVELSKRNRRSMHSDWKQNVDRRLGKVATTFTGGTTVQDDIQTEVNPDWSLTKTKTANLYSQVPTVQGTHENKQFAPAVSPFVKALNYEIGEKRANIGPAMEEALNDVVNASGIAAIHVGYMARFDEAIMPVEETIPHPDDQTKLVPTKDIPQDHLQKLADAGVLRLKKTKTQTDYKFFTNRRSPTDLLWPADFVGSNFDDADYVGESGHKTWAEASVEWELDELDKDSLVKGSESRQADDDLRGSTEKPSTMATPSLKYDELYYWRYRFDPKEKFFKSIWKIVYVEGKPEPVIHEQWKGQQIVNGKLIGSLKFPIRFLTLTYITDNPVPPSDSAAGRPQVNDLQRSRSQMFQQRAHSIPVRGFNVDKVAPEVQDNLMKGAYQGFIPFSGRGQDAVWEVARASYPAEDFTFDQNTQADLRTTWMGDSGPGLGAIPGGKQTSATSNIVQQNFATRIGQERGRVAYFFLSCCEVLAGLMALYSDFPSLTDEEKQQMQKVWDTKHILHDVVLKIRPDSQIVLDTNQRLEKLFKFLNMTVKSGFVNPKPIIVEIAELSGVDPADVIIDPQPPKPDSPTISHRFTGKDDLMSPAVLSVISQHGGLPSEEHLEKAKQFLTKAAEPPQEQSPPGAAPGGPAGPPRPPPPGQRGPAGRPQLPQKDAHPSWTAGSRVIKRSRDMGSSGG